MLTAASYWKAREGVTTAEWLGKSNYMCLINKFTAIMRFRKGKLKDLKAFAVEWECFIDSKYNSVTQEIRMQMLF